MMPFGFDFGILLITAAILGYILYRLGQPTIIAYILTGLVLGPALFNIASDSFLIEVFGELGLAFLLFFLGIEMNLKELKSLLWPLARIGFWQTILQTALAFFVAYVLGFTSIEVLIIALCTVFGATPVVVKLLADKGELDSLPGRIDTGVLVLQDIYIIALLALLSADSLTGGWVVVTELGKILSLIGLLGFIIYVLSKNVLPTHFKRAATNQHVFFIHSIAWAFIFIAIGMWLDLSIETGAFLAGLGLGQIEFRKDLKERVRPLTTFFILIFFSSIGLQLEASNLTAYWVEAVIAGAVLTVGNFLIMYWLINREEFSRKTSFLGAINMTQTSEFSLVVGALAVSQGYVDNDILGFLSLMAVLTMMTSSVMIYRNEQMHSFFKPYLWGEDHEDGNEFDKRKDHTLIVGYDDSMKHLVERLPLPICIVDSNPDLVSTLTESEHDYIYGNIFNREIRNEADIKDAGILISLVPRFETTKQLIQEASEDALKVVRAETANEAQELYLLGADYVIVGGVLVGERLEEVLRAWNTDQKFNEIRRDKELVMKEVM